MQIRLSERRKTRLYNLEPAGEILGEKEEAGK
jgi:hypothetical protein